MATNFYGARNNVSTTVATAYAGGLGSLVVASGSGFLYTDGSALSTTKPIIVSTFLANGTPKGVYRCEARSGNTLTLLSLLSGTDSALSVGDLVEMRWCAEHDGQLATAVNATETAVAGLAIGTTVQAWDTDLDAIAAVGPTKGRFLVGNGTVWAAFGVGTNGQVVTADSAQTLGVKWAAAGGGAGGADTQVQFNDSGVLNGHANFVIAKSNGQITVNADIICDGGSYIRSYGFADRNNSKGNLYTGFAGVNFQLQNQVTTNIPWINKAVAAQTADLHQNLKSDSTILSAWDKLGRPYTGSTLPTLAAGSGAGTSPTGVSVAGTDVNGVISFTTGTSCPASAVVVTLTFSTGYAAAPKSVVLTPANVNAAALTGGSRVYVDSAGISTTKFDLSVTATALADSTAYKFFYTVLG